MGRGGPEPGGGQQESHGMGGPVHTAQPRKDPVPHLQATGVCVGVGGAEDAGAMGSGDGLRNLAAGALKRVFQGGHRMCQKQAGGEGQEGSLGGEGPPSGAHQAPAP